MLKKSIVAVAAGCLVAFTAQAQSPENWFNLDPSNDGVQGLSTERTYKELLKDRKSETVIVAVLDSGVDPLHEDLKDIMWINEDEIPGNGIDDDKNGYIDDIHGWNFIGGKDGKHVNVDTYEMTRVYAAGRKKFADAKREDLSKKEKAKYDYWLKAKEGHEAKRKELEAYRAQIDMTRTMIGSFKEQIDKAMAGKKMTMANVEASGLTDKTLEIAKGLAEEGQTTDDFVADVEKQMEGTINYVSEGLDFQLNPDFDPRNIVGDDYSNADDRNYGNNDVQGPDAGHGTHVAGIIGAIRNNGIGMDGVADNVRIMSVRCVPNGDERDKDVANSIRYAVDNGATIINMSFGKGFTWDEEAVEKAMKYAVKNDVLLVHAAGNSSMDNDVEDNFPNDDFDEIGGWFSPKQAKTWMEIGAGSYRGGEDALAGFSNYGKDNVDIFSPGHHIYSTVPGSKYDTYSGTSMAAPATAGVAALLRSYFPELSAKQIKQIIMDSNIPYLKSVKIPGKEETTLLKNICKTGGFASAYTAVKLAEKTKGKRKSKFRKAAKNNANKQNKKA